VIGGLFLISVISVIPDARRALLRQWVEVPWAAFSPSSKKKLSESVWLCQTSGDVYSLADVDGWGLLQGNVQKLGYKDAGRYVLVAYRPFPNPDALALARVDLATGGVTEVEDSSGAITRSLREVSSFMR